VLYCGRYTNAFIPLDLETGTPLWKFSDWETFLPSTPVFYKDQVIIGTTISSNHIYSLKRATGEKNWELSVKGIFFVRPIIVQDSILVINSTDPFSDKWGILYFINLEKGKILNEIHLENAPESSPICYNDRILIGGSDGLYAFKFKQALGNHGTSAFSFDDIQVWDTINVNESFDKSFPLINTSNFCDTVKVSFETNGDGTKSNISFTERKGYHIRPAQKIDITLKAKANKLNPGNYQIKITIRSARQASDPLYEKTINLTVIGAAVSGENSIKPKRCVASPNPFKGHVSFLSGNSENTLYTLTICTMNGRSVYSGQIDTAGENGKMEWNGCDKGGINVPAGLYVYRLTSGNYHSMGKLIKIE